MGAKYLRTSELSLPGPHLPLSLVSGLPPLLATAGVQEEELISDTHFRAPPQALGERPGCPFPM